MNLSCIIIDDEPNAVNLLEILIRQTTEWQLLAKCYDALEAMAFLKKNKVDFIFLDINMPQLTGMELVRPSVATGNQNCIYHSLFRTCCRKLYVSDRRLFIEADNAEKVPDIDPKNRVALWQKRTCCDA